jgi:hypothetical protein
VTLALQLGAWLNGRKERDLFRVFRPNEWQPTEIALVVVAIAIGGLSSNLLATMISTHGLSETYSLYPVKASIYTALIVVCALITTITVTR